MNQIIEIDTSLIDAVQNNRLDFSHVPGLAESIRERGQDAPITVVATPDGRYRLIAGESRTRACALLGIPVKAIVRDDLTAADGYMLTLVENDARKQTNDMEKAIGYKRAIDEHGYTVEDIAKHIGKKGQIGVRFVSDRLSLLGLRDELQKLVQDGQLTIGYAIHMTELDSNRQLIAMRHLRENPSPTTKWFASVCGQLLAEQRQQGLFSFGYSDNQQVEETAVKTPTPANPIGYAPSLSSLARQPIVDEIKKWNDAAHGWMYYGNERRADACRTIVSTLENILSLLPAQESATFRQGGDIVSESKGVATIGRLLSQRGSMSVREIYQYSKLNKEETAVALETLVESGKATKARSGRGYRYEIAEGGGYATLPA